MEGRSSRIGDFGPSSKVSTKFQAPTSREASNRQYPKKTPRMLSLKFGDWNFSGAWMLEFGAYLDRA
jgi:hypothetical protein